jgi:hypothetical protein
VPGRPVVASSSVVISKIMLVIPDPCFPLPYGFDNSAAPCVILVGMADKDPSRFGHEPISLAGSVLLSEYK